MTEQLLIAALGSSFAAGPTLEPVVDAAAMRSSRNYAHLLADDLGARLVDLSVSGATTTTILDEPQVTMSGARFAPQVEGLPAGADVVTITAGGNDLGFLGAMIYCASRRVDPTGPITQMLGQGLLDGLPEPTVEAVGRTAAGLARIVTEARCRAAGARVLLVDYLTIVSPDGDRSTADLFSAEETALFLRIQEALAEAYRLAAGRVDAELVTASVLSRAHALGSDDPWVQGFDAAAPEKLAGAFHPNHAGMEAVSREVARVVRGRRP